MKKNRSRKPSRPRRSGRLKFVAIFAVVFLVVASALGAIASMRWVLPMHDRIVGLEEDVRREWADLDALLQRRYALIPNIVATAERAAGSEREVFLEIADSYTGYQRARSIDERMAASYRIERGLRMICGRPYPSLSGGNAAYARLMSNLEETENGIAAQRMRYNESVARLNSTVRSIEGRATATVFGFRQAPYYEPPDHSRHRPDVDFESPLKSRARESVVEHRRDPFEIEPRRNSAGTDSSQPQLSRGDIRFVGVMTSQGQQTALLELPDGSDLTVRQGDTIPAAGLRVRNITPSGVSYEDI